MPIFPLVHHSVLFLVDGEVDGEDELVGTVYPFEEFPWHKKPGLMVWSVTVALEQLLTTLKLSTLVEKQVQEYFHRPGDQWWVCTSPMPKAKAPAIEGAYIKEVVPAKVLPRDDTENYVYFSSIKDEQRREEIIPQTVRRSHGPLPKPPMSEFLLPSLGPPPTPLSESE